MASRILQDYYALADLDTLLYDTIDWTNRSQASRASAATAASTASSISDIPSIHSTTSTSTSTESHWWVKAFRSLTCHLLDSGTDDEKVEVCMRKMAKTFTLSDCYYERCILIMFSTEFEPSCQDQSELVESSH